MAKTPRTLEQKAAEHQRKANALRAKAAKQKRERDTRYYLELGKLFESMALSGNYRMAEKAGLSALLLAIGYHGSGESARWLDQEIRRRMEEEQAASQKTGQ